MIDYANASYQQLAVWLKSYLNNKGLTCEKGHRDCGCSPIEHPPCVLAVMGEIESRRTAARVA